MADQRSETEQEFCVDNPNLCGGCWGDQGGGDCGSPLVVDLDGDGFRFGGVGRSDTPVLFDIDADGSPVRLGWIEEGARDAFLVLDRDANGLIDDGSEMFGTASRLSDGSRALNGFEALLEFDGIALGGNGDGWITSEDAIFQSLRLWLDLNRDGISSPDELLPLSAESIRAIGLSPVVSARRDRYGNELRYKSDVQMEIQDQIVHRQIVDVFFVEQR